MNSLYNILTQEYPFAIALAMYAVGYITASIINRKADTQDHRPFRYKEYPAPMRQDPPIKECVGGLDLWHNGEKVSSIATCHVDTAACKITVNKSDIAEDVWNKLSSLLSDTFIDIFKAGSKPFNADITLPTVPRTPILSIINVCPKSMSPDRIVLEGDRYSLHKEAYSDGNEHNLP